MVFLGDGIAKVLSDAHIVVIIVQEVDPVPKAKLGFSVEANKVQLVNIASTKDQAPSGALVDFQEKFARVLGNRKKKYRVDFFGKASFSGLTNYVIRHNSQNGNMMSLPWALCSRWPRCLTSLANPPCWSLFECYALKVIL